jgi:hypothetical protein
MSKEKTEESLPEYELSTLKVRTMGAGWKARRNPEGIFAQKVNKEWKIMAIKKGMFICKKK